MSGPPTWTETLAKRPPKRTNVLDLVKSYASRDAYIIMTHATERSVERRISEPEFRHVLINGWHEKRKDSFVSEYGDWNYAIRGYTQDQRELRVIVSIDLSNLLIITVIDLDIND